MILRKLKSIKILLMLVTVPITLYMIHFFNFEQVRIYQVNKLLSYGEFHALFKKFDKISFKNYNQKKNLIFLLPDKNTTVYLNIYKMDLSFYDKFSDSSYNNVLIAAELFSLLKKENAILLDIEILKNINVLGYLDGLKRVSNFQKPSLITFGIHPDSFHQLNEVT